ncbi:MAG: futalosine hydrolase [Deltaproteobacteria bacterium]|nr:futalosine hydrolase [Deltaproteobacteria bacterium]
MARHLIVSATQFEIQPVLQRLDMHSMFEGTQGAAFRRGSQNVDVLVSGVGQMQTSFHLGQALMREQYSSVLNFGIAGSFRPQFAKCSLVHVVQEELADLGADDNGRAIDLFEMKLLNRNVDPFQDGVLTALPLELDSISDLPKVKSITVNRVLGAESSIAAAVAKYDPDVVNMEGAAVFYATRLSGIRCASIRAISDQVGPRDKSKWDIPGAIKNLCMKANEILDELLEQN